MQRTTNVAVLLFDDVEPLDFCGPYQVFTATRMADRSSPFHVFTCAEKTQPVWALNQLSINPQFPLHNCPAPDVLVVPGGSGTRQQINNPRLIEWLRVTASRTEIVLSVCTGALLLAKAGLLDGLEATTHHDFLDLLREISPKAQVRASERFLDNGRVVVAAGISAGLDAALHVVARLVGVRTAKATAAHMEYHWIPKSPRAAPDHGLRVAQPARRS